VGSGAGAAAGKYNYKVMAKRRVKDNGDERARSNSGKQDTFIEDELQCVGQEKSVQNVFVVAKTGNPPRNKKFLSTGAGATLSNLLSTTLPTRPLQYRPKSYSMHRDPTSPESSILHKQGSLQSIRT